MPLKSLDNRMLWEMFDRYTIKDGKAGNTFHNDVGGIAGPGLPLQEMLDDIEAAQEPKK